MRITVDVPQKGNAVLGQVAGLYVLTYADTAIINGGVVTVLNVLHDIVSLPPTTTSGKTYTWGPGAASPLDPNVWELTVTDNGDGTYSYTLQGAKKNTTNFVTVLSGTHTPVKTNGVNDPDHGSGTFLIDWNARATLALTDGNVGTGNVTYNHVNADVTVDVVFTGVHTGGGVTANADGVYEFSDQSNIDPATSALETVNIESRWDPTGAGRSDVNVTGGDLGTSTATVSECWDDNFLETYYLDSGNWQAPQGMETSCPADFQAAVYYMGS